MSVFKWSMILLEIVSSCNFIWKMHSYNLGAIDSFSSILILVPYLEHFILLDKEKLDRLYYLSD